jgi:hypothetical protein
MTNFRRYIPVDAPSDDPSVGRQLFDPEVYPDRELTIDRTQLRHEGERHCSRVEQLHEDMAAAREEIGDADTKMVEHLRKQKAAKRLEDLEIEKTKAERIRQRYGLCLAIQHGRAEIERGAVDVSITDLLDGAKAPELADSITAKLAQAGLSSADIVEILDLLALEAAVKKTQTAEPKLGAKLDNQFDNFDHE